MSGMRARLRSLSSCVVLTLLATSCASYRPVKLADLPGGLNPGDTVRVVTRDGKESRFEVTSVTPDALAGDDQRIELADVRELERREVSAARTTGLVVVVALGVALAVVAAIAAAYAALLGAG